jgi:hypothetical protein
MEPLIKIAHTAGHAADGHSGSADPGHSRGRVRSRAIARWWSEFLEEWLQREGSDPADVVDVLRRRTVIRAKLDCPEEIPFSGCPEGPVSHARSYPETKEQGAMHLQSSNRLETSPFVADTVLVPSHALGAWLTSPSSPSVRARGPTHRPGPFRATTHSSSARFDKRILS